MAKSLLDLLPVDEARKAIERGKRRLEANKSKQGIDIYPELFIVGKAGEYWGWEAILDIRRGYVINPDLDEDGNIFYTKSILTLDEVMVLLEASNKVRRSQDINNIHSAMVAGSFKTTSKSFDQAIKPFTQGAEIKE